MSFFGFVCRDWLQIDEKTAKLIWHPAIMFENLLNFKLTKSYGNADQNNLWLEGNQSHAMQYGEEFQLTFSCHFHLSKFPFDSHECPIYFEDRRYSTNMLSINDIRINYAKSWTGVGDDPLILYDLGLPYEFELEALPTKEMDIDYNYNVSQAGMVIKIKKRSLGQLLSGYYYPTASFAMLSMVSFLIHPDVVRETQVLSLALFGMTLEVTIKHWGVMLLSPSRF